MSDWIEFGEQLLNLDAVEHIEKISHKVVRVSMKSGTHIDIEGPMSANLWNYISSQRLPFLDVNTPARNF